MSIHKDYDKYVLTCDICQDECEEDFEFWGDAVDYVVDKVNGWSKRYEGGGWIDICPDCREGGKDEQD